ncbi:hypothetical protein A6A28_31985 [Streptomyces sp. CB03578]|uniref:hypothetical protein n=1 Tax=Streptomyces sp. CB03578 TaxID=1718987 RepID=UPI00093D9AEA|nr:hypothetical protein [Streptomyces sp. CB03578]OKI37717.1 hypothetical protein A6A28_31985 [Streptomyces sp. CB03578]
MALLFTAATFWWLNARLGVLKSWEPQTYAMSLNRDYVRVRLPLVMYNTGARPIVVLDLRMRFPDEPDAFWPLVWTGTSEELMPKSADDVVAPTGFAIAGRTAEQLVVSFTVPSPGFIPEVRDYQVVIEAVLGQRKLWQRVIRRDSRWQPFARFGLRMGPMRYTGSFGAYSNSPLDLQMDTLRAPGDAMERLTLRLRDERRGSS